MNLEKAKTEAASAVAEHAATGAAYAKSPSTAHAAAYVAAKQRLDLATIVLDAEQVKEDARQAAERERQRRARVAEAKALAKTTTRELGNQAGQVHRDRILDATIAVVDAIRELCKIDSELTSTVDHIVRMEIETGEQVLPRQTPQSPPMREFRIRTHQCAALAQHAVNRWTEARGPIDRQTEIKLRAMCRAVWEVS